MALSVKKAEEAVTDYFDQILSGAEFSYIRKSQPKDNNDLEIERLQKELSKLEIREKRIREAMRVRLTHWKNTKPIKNV